MSLSLEANFQVRISLDLYDRDVERMGVERAKSQVAIGFTWLNGHKVDEDATCEQAAALLEKLGGSVSYSCATPGTRNYIELVDGTFRTEVR